MARILLSCVHYPVAAGRYVYWALRRMGHEVVTVGPAAGAYLPWANGTNLEPYEWKPDIPFRQEGEAWIHPTIDFSGVDLVIQMDAHFSLPMRPPCPNVLWAIDNHLGEYGAYDTFDKIFIAHSWGYMKDLPQTEWLPCAYDPLQHFVIDPNAPRPIDVALVGVGYPKRAAMVQALRAAGIKVLATTGKIYGEYNAIYNQAKIALVVSSCGDVAMRVFENMAQGCLVVADEAVDMAKCGFTDANQYLKYKNVEDCVDMIDYELKDWPMNDAPGMGTMINSARAAVAPHTWEARVKRILEAVNLG